MSKCLFCGKEITKDKNNKFCNQSHAASYNNVGVRRHGKSKSICICGKINSSSKRTYCSTKCQQDEAWNKRKKRFVDTGKCDSSSRTAKRFLIECYGSKCSICNESLWMGQPIPIILDHIDGNSDNWAIINLRLVCPNCDAQLPTFKSKNIGHGRFYRRKRYKENKSY